jgi:hypothetical protein
MNKVCIASFTVIQPNIRITILWIPLNRVLLVLSLKRTSQNQFWQRGKMELHQYLPRGLNQEVVLVKWQMRFLIDKVRKFPEESWNTIKKRMLTLSCSQQSTLKKEPIWTHSKLLAIVLSQFWALLMSNLSLLAFSSKKLGIFANWKISKSFHIFGLITKLKLNNILRNRKASKKEKVCQQ